MKQKQLKSNLVHYDTQWINTNPQLPNRLYFKAGTPIETIVNTLETQVNKDPDKFKENYQTSAAHQSFNRLYRNLIPYYKGWQVLYRKPEWPNKNYGLINEKIGYTSRKPKTSFKFHVFTKPMHWTHELDPLVHSVTIQKTSSCEMIAEELNKSVLAPCYQVFFNQFKKDLSRLNASYEICQKTLINSDNKTLRGKSNSTIQALYDKLTTMSRYLKTIDSWINKDYTIYPSNVNDILQPRRNVYSTKGWRVEFISNSEPNL